MDGLLITLVILGVILIIAFVAWIYLVDKKFSKAMILLCDSLLIILSVAVLVVGLQLRDRTLKEERNFKEKEISEQIENENIYNEDIQENLN